MSKMFTSLFVIGLLAVAANGAVVLEWELATEPGPIGSGSYPSGYVSFDLMMTVDTNIAQIQLYMQSASPAVGDFYQDALGTNWTPNPAIIPSVPDLEFDTYATLPVAGDIRASAANVVPGVRALTFDSQLLDIMWSVDTATFSGSGKHQVARITIKDTLTTGGFWGVWGQELGTPVPTPATASGTFADLPWPSAGIPGDFNDDTSLDALDIDLLVADINTPSGDPKFDVNSSGGNSTAADLTYWVEVLKSTKLGDANLDLKVDGLDLNILGGNWQQSPKGWADGNSNTDAIVDGLDLNILGGNWQWGVPEPVPEPTVIALLAVGMVAVIRKRKA